MTDVPWDRPATVWRYVRGLDRERADFAGNLRDAVIFTLAQTNSRGDGYIIRTDDGSHDWEGPAIAELGRRLEDG
jgi:hypothetical protein